MDNPDQQCDIRQASMTVSHSSQLGCLSPSVDSMGMKASKGGSLYLRHPTAGQGVISSIPMTGVSDKTTLPLPPQLRRRVKRLSAQPGASAQLTAKFSSRRSQGSNIVDTERLSLKLSLVARKRRGKTLPRRGRTAKMRAASRLTSDQESSLTRSFHNLGIE